MRFVVSHLWVVCSTTITLIEKLLEIAVQQLGSFGEHGQGGVHAHGAHGFLAGRGHVRDDRVEIFARIAEQQLSGQQPLQIG